MSQLASNHSRPNSNPQKPPKCPTSKNEVISWIACSLNISSQHLSIQQLGDGAYYCRLLNTFVPDVISANRIIDRPSNEYQSGLNLKMLQLALKKLNINIPFDIHKLARKTFIDNWNFVCLLYKHFGKNNERKL